jgi:hypothetical protein
MANEELELENNEATEAVETDSVTEEERDQAFMDLNAALFGGSDEPQETEEVDDSVTEETPEPTKAGPSADELRWRQAEERNQALEQQSKALQAQVKQAVEFAQKAAQESAQVQALQQQIQFLHQQVQQQRQPQQPLTEAEKWERDLLAKAQAPMGQFKQAADKVAKLEQELANMQNAQKEAAQKARRDAQVAMFKADTEKARNEVLLQGIDEADRAALSDDLDAMIMNASAAFRKMPNEVVHDLAAIFDKWHNAKLASARQRSLSKKTASNAAPSAPSKSSAKSKADPVSEYANELKKMDYKSMKEGWLDKLFG